MLIKFRKILISLLVIILFACKKDITLDRLNGNLEPGVIFTFDDNYYDDWINSLPIFDKYDAKVTFFISPGYRWKRQKNDDKKILQLYNAGHEIGSHTWNHPKLVNFLKNHTLNEYYKSEILPTLKLFDSLNITVDSFAYPFGINTAESDSFLLQYFRKIRTVAEYDKPGEYKDIVSKNERIVKGLALGESIGNDLGIYKAALLNAKENSGILVLIQHRIVKKATSKVSFTYDKLDSICSYVEKLRMKFYRLKDI